jgi:SWI/SNF-related matrix-associated actin-dependent regulator 1 of chromatin subfamily A
MPRPVAPPESLPHQVEGTAFLRENERAALFDEQGLGKSKQLIDAIVGEVAAGSIQCALIICPNTLKQTWADEIERFSGAKYAVFGSGKKARRLAFSSLRATFYVINYEAVASELTSLRALAQFKPMALVLDESHRIKTPESKVTKAILALRTSAARRYILTGTPVANKPEDLWSQMLFLDDGAALGETFQQFQARYATGSGGYRNVEEMRGHVAELSLRRTKATSLNLPPKNYIRIGIPLAPTTSPLPRHERPPHDPGHAVVRSRHAPPERLARRKGRCNRYGSYWPALSAHRSPDAVQCSADPTK